MADAVGRATAGARVHTRRVTQDGYLLDNAVAAAGPRLDVLAQLFDPSTFRHIDALGIVPGWRCWEVGAGGASVVRWLAGRVGPAGRVLATDIDVSWTRAAAADNVRIQRHDVAADPPPDLVFDLVHARLVLIHVAERERALRQMISTLRPGGWLLVEDADSELQPLVCLDPRSPAEVLANRIHAESRAMLAERGADLAYGRKLPRALRVLPGRAARDRRAGAQDHRADRRSADRQRAGDRRRDRAPPRQRRRRRARPRDPADDLGVGPAPRRGRHVSCGLALARAVV